MDKKPLHPALRVGLSPFVSEEADREQWKLAPKVLGPSIAERITARSIKTTPAEKNVQSDPESCRPSNP